MRTTMKSTILWEKIMKILEEYKKFAKELLIEIDDEQILMIKTKKKKSQEIYKAWLVKRCLMNIT